MADRLSPSETPSRRLARLRAYAISSKGLMGRLDPRVSHTNTISEGATARSLAPIMPAGIQRRGHSRTISPESPCLSSSTRGGRASTPRSSPTTARNSGQNRPDSAFHRLPPPNNQNQTPTTTQYLSGLAPKSSRGSARDLGRGIPLNRESPPPLKTPDTNSRSASGGPARSSSA